MFLRDLNLDSPNQIITILKLNRYGYLYVKELIIKKKKIAVPEWYPVITYPTLAICSALHSLSSPMTRQNESAIHLHNSSL